jgi:hypothetical protein
LDFLVKQFQELISKKAVAGRGRRHLALRDGFLRKNHRPNRV